MNNLKLGGRVIALTGIPVVMWIVYAENSPNLPDVYYYLAQGLLITIGIISFFHFEKLANFFNKYLPEQNS